VTIPQAIDRALRVAVAPVASVPAPVIPADRPFRAWCEDMGRAGLMIDGHPFRLDDRRALWELYDQVPTTAAEAFGRTVVLQKSSQMGATVLAMLANLYLAVKFAPCKTLYYLPDRGMAGDLSTTRFMPVARSIPAVHQLITGGGKDEGNTLTRLMPGIGTVFRFLWTSAQPGGVTESFPGDCLFLDEVQGMTLEQIDRVHERLSASAIRWRLLLSTPLFPDLDINAWYLRGDQRKYHSGCACADGVVLTDVFFDAFLNNRPDDYPVRFDGAAGDYRYFCPRCSSWVDDPQEGRWVPHNPGAAFRSYHLSQILSPTITARELLEAARAVDTADRRQNFACRKLGTPFADASQLLATAEILQRCADAGQRLGVRWKASGSGCFMGCDQMGGFIVATVAERLPDGRMAVVHVECIYALDPWARLDGLMAAYGVVVCVLEQLPNIDSARGFAHRHEGAAWLITSYGDLEEFCRWGDVTVTKSDRKTAGEYRDRWTLRADRYRVLDWAAARFREGFIVFPDPLALQADYRDDRGQAKRGPVLKDVFWHHYIKTGLVLKSDETVAEVKSAKREIIKLGIDPHASFSLLCLCVAWFRAFGTASFILPGVTVASKTEAVREAVEGRMPGLPPAVVEMFVAPEGACGACSAFAAGLCRERGVLVGPADPGCDLYVPAGR
jgi:hypothetical protein